MDQEAHKFRLEINWVKTKIQTAECLCSISDYMCTIIMWRKTRSSWFAYSRTSVLFSMLNPGRLPRSKDEVRRLRVVLTQKDTAHSLHSALTRTYTGHNVHPIVEDDSND